MSPPTTVFFLSDYGLVDEFVGVVHAVINAQVPEVTVIDLGHHVPAYDIRAGARMLERAVPFLGRGIVLAVVDPGVGGSRRGVVLHCLDPARPQYLVGPDNGLMLAAAQRLGGVASAVELLGDGRPTSATFDGRDLFAPAVAGLCGGASLQELGRPVDADSLVPLDVPVMVTTIEPDGRISTQTEVVWVDHFGNVALALRSTEVKGFDLGRLCSLVVESPGEPTVVTVRRVRFFSELGMAEIGLMADANGSLSLVADQESAAEILRLTVGQTVHLTW